MAFPTNEIETSLREAAEGRLGVGAWLEQLFASTVWAPVASAAGGGGSFPVLSFEGGSYVAVFTSEEELARAQPQAGFVVAPFRELVERLPEHLGVAVNPGGTLGLPVPAADLRRILDPAGTIPAGSTLRVGHPAVEPSEVLAEVTSRFGSLPAVRAARRCWAGVDEQQPGLVLGVDVDPDSDATRQGVLEAVRSAAAASGYPGSVDVVFANDRDALTSWMQENAEPFFRADAG